MKQIDSERQNTEPEKLQVSRNKIQQLVLPLTVLLLSAFKESDVPAHFEHCPENRLSGLSGKLPKLSLDVQFQSSYPTSFRGISTICLLSHLALTYVTQAKNEKVDLRCCVFAR